MRSRNPNLPTRLSVLAGLLFGIAALGSAGWESVSFGHAHPGDGITVRHHHVFLQGHEHSGEATSHAAPAHAAHAADTADPDHHRPDRHPGDPHPRERDIPKRSARTIPLALTALLQPAVIQGFAAPPADPATFVPLVALPLLVRSLDRPAGPRPPPSFSVSNTVSDLLG